MRKHDWAERLANYLAANMHTSFVWGEFDCCLFAANAIIETHGVDFAAPFRGHYSTATGSVRALKKYGQGDIESTLNAIFGPIKPRLKANRGDVALIHTPSGKALGIVFGGAVYAATENGLTNLPMKSVIGSWEVSCLQ